ncbi:Activin receptor type-2A [Eumeta japonica]|uniref:Serine/threonine-protein kinase receptor n=1 Tax=Eumeta variegata TaxID=151549 RepID=A0A4C1XRM6_EUMVA|nr:Activin receptor type-2A [Eumeta japonica]
MCVRRSRILPKFLIFLLGIHEISLAELPFRNEEKIPPRPREGGIETRNCAFYNISQPATQCDPNNTTCPPLECEHVERDECSPIESGKSNHCFVLWLYDNITGEASVYLKGCFVSTVACNDLSSNCIMHSSKLPLLHCCCEGDMCNANMTFPGLAAIATGSPPTRIPTTPKPEEDESKAMIAYLLTPLLVLLSALSVCYVLYRKRKGSSFAQLPSGEILISRPPSAGAGMENEIGGLCSQVMLCEVRAHGRFGAVWRAKLGHRDVAVKVFPIQDKQSWLAEQEIYRLPRMDHPDILHYIGVDKKGDNLQAEYWLITAYHEKGSLCDYLKAHTLTWSEAWRVAACVARGLAHLHEEGGGQTSCSPSGCGDAHGQVGTRRYMAPEVLDGAINFTKDAFLRIDMYACALVLWEIASRCQDGGADGSMQYRLPLEEEVGSHPSLEEMQDAVVLKKLRPIIPKNWREHPGLSVLCDTMEECWDHDAEARLSASCVLERVAAQRPVGAAPAPPLAATNPVILAPDTAPLLIHELQH